jgi:hypothetical protein
MSFFGGSLKTTTNTTKSEQPDYIEDSVKRILREGERIVDQQPYPIYSGERLARPEQQSIAGTDLIWNMHNAPRQYGGGVINNLNDARLNFGGDTLDELSNQNLNFGGQYAENIAQQGIGRFNPADAAQMRRQEIRDVQGGSFPGSNLSQYMNPYMQSVGDVAEREMRRSHAVGEQQDSAAARQAGAWGGSRHGIVDAERDRNLERNLGDMRTGILGQGFDRASGLISQDLNRRLQADTLNQGADTTTATANLGQRGQTNLTNAQLGVQHQTADANARLSAANQMAQSASAQNAAMLGQAAGRRDASTAETQAGLGIAGGLRDSTTARLAGDTNIAQSMMAAGDWQQNQAQQYLDRDYGDFMAQAEHPKSQLEWLMSLNQGAPKTMQQTTTGQYRQPGMGQQLLGTAMQIGAKYAMG